MIGDVLRRWFAVGEVETAAGRAVVEERFIAIRQQVPVVYIIALVNLAGLELATRGELSFGLNVPTLIVVCAAFRIVQWLRAPKAVPPNEMLRRLKQTCWLTAVICVLVCWWCLQIRVIDTVNGMAIMLFGSLTAIGVSYGLGPLPPAARLPLLVLALPLAATGFLSNDPHFIGAALSLLVVSLLMLRMLIVNNSHFTGVIESRSIIVRQQQLAESARQEAIVAATTDFLTGLPNRRAFVMALDTHLSAKGGRGLFALGILDLDRFKIMNDTFGHASGDRLLQLVAERLLAAAGDKAVVARLGGDEFGLLFPNVRSAGGARKLAEKIVAHVNRPAVINGRHFPISVCCGLAVAKATAERTASRMLANADLALYDAKDRAGGSVALFEPWMEAPHQRRAKIERALHLPEVQDRIGLVFQPIFDLQSGQVIANEALARWTDEELGEISPAEFVPLAEQLNVIGSLTNRLMAKAFRQAAEWPDPIRLSFNLSAVQLCAADSACVILDALKRSGLRPERLQVEVTETALLRDFDQAQRNLAVLRDAGVMIVLDDFGAGYASIGYLRQLRFDQIKLDGALLTAALDSPDGERLLSAVIGLCNALGVATVAEHVENQQQLDLLLKLGCAGGQGFWLKKPMPGPECNQFSRSPGTVLHLARPARKRTRVPCASDDLEVSEAHERRNQAATTDAHVRRRSQVS